MLLETRNDILEASPTHNVINHHQVMPNVKFEVLCQSEHNTAIKITASATKHEFKIIIFVFDCFESAHVAL